MFFRMCSNINKQINIYISNNQYLIILLIACFVFGNIWGIVYANSISQTEKEEVLSYINDINVSIQEESINVKWQNIFASASKSILLEFLVIMFLGCTAVLANGIYLVLIYKGIKMGFCISILVMCLGNLKGVIFALISLLLPNIVALIFLIYFSIFWLDFANLIHESSYLKIKDRIYKSIIFSIIIIASVMLVLGTLQVLSTNLVYNFIKIL